MNDLRALQMLLSVARTGSFTETARLHGTTTAAVSKAVSRLERELGTRLFHRTTRQVSLTGPGRLFVDKAATGLEHFSEATELLRREKDEPAGPVRLSSNAAFGKAQVLPLVAEFLRMHPRVELEMRFHDGLLDMTREGYDIAIENQPFTSGSYVCRLLCEMPLALVASPDYLARHGTPVWPADLAEHQCINVRLNSGQPAAWRFRPLPRPGQRTGGVRQSYTHVPKGQLIIAEQYDAVTNAALEGLGATVVLVHSVRRFLLSNELKILLPDYRVESVNVEDNRMYIRYAQRKFLSSAARALIDQLVRHCGDARNLAIDLRKHAA